MKNLKKTCKFFMVRKFLKAKIRDLVHLKIMVKKLM